MNYAALGSAGPERWSRRRHGATSKNVPAQPLTRAFTPSTWHSFRGGAAGEHGPLSPLTKPSGAWAIRRPQLPGVDLLQNVARSYCEPLPKGSEGSDREESCGALGALDLREENFSGFCLWK